MTASQRSRTRVSRRPLRPVRWASSAGWSLISNNVRLRRMCSTSTGASARGPIAAMPLASCAAPRHICGSAQGDLMLKTVEPAIAVDQLVKVYKTTRAVDGISFALEPGSITGLLGGNGAGKTTTLAMVMGLIMPTSGTVKVLGAEMPRQRYQVLHEMNFESPYVDMPQRLLVRYGRETLEEVFLDVARGRGEAREAAQ